MIKDEGLIIAVIPTRGGSQGVPGKNIKLLGGKPLIAYSIKAAKNSGVVDRVFVSTDSEEIAEVSKKYGAEIIDTTKGYSYDLATESYLRYAIDKIEDKGIKIKLIVFLQATSPFRTGDVIKKAVEKIYKENYDSVLSVFPTYRYFGELKNGEYVAFRKIRKRRQEMTPWYCDNGAVYVIKRSVFNKSKNRYGGKIGIVIMSEEDSMEIDNFDDWWLAEQLVKKKTEKD